MLQKRNSALEKEREEKAAERNLTKTYIHKQLTETKMNLWQHNIHDYRRKKSE